MTFESLHGIMVLGRPEKEHMTIQVMTVGDKSAILPCFETCTGGLQGNNRGNVLSSRSIIMVSLTSTNRTSEKEREREVFFLKNKANNHEVGIVLPPCFQNRQHRSKC